MDIQPMDCQPMDILRTEISIENYTCARHPTLQFRKKNYFPFIGAVLWTTKHFEIPFANQLVQAPI